MKLKHLICLMATIMLCLSLPLLFTSCGDSTSLEDRGYTVKVTYNFNGGIVDETAERVLYYKQGQPLLRPGDSNEFKEPSLDALHSVAGWYRALTDEDGTVKKDGEGRILTEDTPIDFSRTRATENMTLVVKWKENPTVTVMVDGRDPDVRTYNVGATVPRFSRIDGREGYTFYDYYIDEACTEKVQWPLTLGDGDHITVYTKWFEGDVLVIRGLSDMKNLKEYRNKTVYLDADIDYAGSRTEFACLDEFNGTFLGNGHTLKNISFARIDLSTQKDPKSFGLFGALGENAVISDVRFENVRVNLRVTWDGVYPIGILASSAAAGARVENCTFADCTMAYTLLGSVETATLQYGQGTALEGMVGIVDGTPAFTVSGTVTVLKQE